MSSSSMRRLVDFYDPTTKGADSHGRTLDQILGWSDDKLESQHNYIQTVFPLPEESVFSFHAPVVDERTMLVFTRSPELKSNLLRALKRMLAFYGFDTEDKEGSNLRLTITPKENWQPGFSHWVVRMDHNHLRITRIIRSLRILGLQGAAEDFYNALMAVQELLGRIGASSIAFWTRAMKNPLSQAPDGSEVTWLEKY
ncbi:opioid growth factor receptor conserved domain-containing protein [Xylaria scruposa]|nr:opioid growth factor receptor conserved domain-containing protein [Xylaria scruposa]